jgi:transcriptional regulator
MTLRRNLIDLLTSEPRTASSLARELGLRRGDIESELPHLLRTARAAGGRVIVDPARCRSCGFTFGDDLLHKPGRCPACRGERVMEPRLRIEPRDEPEDSG